MTYTGLFLIIVAYLIGSLSFAVIISKLFKLQDPRTYGSGNPGATNVLRSGKKKAAALTLLGDALKGFIPVLLASVFARQLDLTGWDLAGISLAVLIGHMWPIYFKFQGGKGVATAIGVLFAVSWPTALGCLLVWLIIVGIFKISSLAALIAALSSPIFAWFFVVSDELKYAIVVIALLVLIRHHSNIKKLLSGQEHVFKKENKKPE
ncbi:glycerol-3-phosphate 1-O-acyltransferase PlsY [Neisseria sp. Ec49-e6-T10]|uniref:glycerol-3-phosphate 1-O-acyltransferase PlsY n=1 Tax=Neisseria sp. Ec49-e6-T10 TaxID=3140744 RepID=UPI003EBBC704